jgi:hypothetical protein
VLNNSIDEYKLIRDELLKLKDCITTYVGFAVAAAAPAFWFLIGKVDRQSASLPMAVGGLALAAVYEAVLLLISYKFTSHNRFAGYCKLLTHEKGGASSKGDVYGWELCIDWLRMSDHTSLPKTLPWSSGDIDGVSTSTLNRMLGKFSGPKPRADGHALWGGLRLMFTGRPESPGSWRFPLYVMRIFFVIDVTLVAASMWVARVADVFHEFWHGLGFGALVFGVAAVWGTLFRKLFRIMAGSETIDAFCWKFVRLRQRLLRELSDDDTRYRLAAADDSTGHRA